MVSGLVAQGMVGGVEGLEDQRTLVGTESGGEHQRTVVVPEPVEVAGLTPAGGVLRFVARLDIGAGPGDAVELGSGGVAGQLDERGLGLRRGDANQRPDLGVGELPGGEGGPNLGQFGKPLRHTEVLAAGHQAHAAAPAQPVGARLRSLVAPAFTPVELGDQLQPAAHGGRQVGGQLTDLVLEVLKRDLATGGFGAGAHGG